MVDRELIPKIKMVAPGTLLRRALDDIVMAEFGALFVFLDDVKAQENILQGGFYIGTSFSPEKLYELAKMDGAILLDEGVSRILAANVQLAPDPTLPTDETGMRHRAAERTARQTGKFVMTISRRRKVITLYYRDSKYQLHDINHLITRIYQTIGTVERYKTILDTKATRIQRDEFLDQVQLIQVVELIGDAVVILNLLAEIAPYVIETGTEGRLPAMRLNSVRDEVDALLRLLAKDYCLHAQSDTEVGHFIAALDPMAPADGVKIAALLGWSVAGDADLHDITVKPRGYRLLKQVTKIPTAMIENVIAHFKNLTHLSAADQGALMTVEGIGEKRAKCIVDGIQLMRNRSVYR
ncbi:DNA integrity scanning protein DisA [Desulfosarcina cetonica]|uniref:DNA integrity scanning diadenylate cyclase DisA n=1 Tax=Desulfosarcina cetonica TaxID=90730 RepID=UPI0006D1FDFD|nr:DNA integrity scanning diadenylate cyclase DisA [Desulfosarcina cetonica]VTR67404.1 DNA integrity scanning protein DisA [Desulfosarcina cetonica]